MDVHDVSISKTRTIICFQATKKILVHQETFLIWPGRTLTSAECEVNTVNLWYDPATARPRATGMLNSEFVTLNRVDKQLCVCVTLVKAEIKPPDSNTKGNNKRKYQRLEYSNIVSSNTVKKRKAQYPSHQRDDMAVIYLCGWARKNLKLIIVI